MKVKVKLKMDCSCFFKKIFILVCSSFLYLGCGGKGVNVGNTALSEEFSGGVLRPTLVAIDSGDYGIGDYLDISITFSDVVSIQGPEDFSIRLDIGGQERSAGYESGNGTNTLVFRYTVQEGDNCGANGIELFSLISLGDGPLSSLSLDLPDNLDTVRIDGDPPEVSSAVSISDGIYSLGEHIDITVNFNENVFINREEEAPSLALMIGNSLQMASYYSGSGGSSLVFRYTVKQGDSDIDGIAVAPYMVNEDSIMDGSDNPLPPPSITPPSNTHSVCVDTMAPQINEVTVASGNHAILLISVVLNEEVSVDTGNGVPSISINVSGNTRQAVYQSIQGTNTLIFSYTAASGERAINGIDMTPALSLNGGTIRDAAGIALSHLSFTKPTNLRNVHIDGNAPTITNARIASGHYTGHIDITLNASENIIVDTEGGVPFIPLTIGLNSQKAMFYGGSGSSALVFRYTIQPGDNDLDGIDLIPSLSLNGGTMEDSSNSALSTSFPIPSNLSSVFVDTTAPRISEVSVDSGTYSVLSISVTMSEEVIVNTGSGVPHIALDINRSPRQAIYQSGTGTRTLVFSYTAAVNEVDTDGIGMTSLLTLNGGTIQDRAGFAIADLSFTAPTNLADVHIDRFAPTIIGANVSNGYYGEYMDITLTVSKNIVVSGNPFISLDIGGENRRAVYYSGSGSTSLVFRYTIQTGDNDDNGISMTNSIELNGATMEDSSDNALLTHFANVAPSNLDSVIVDTTAPGIERVTIANGSYAILPIVVTMSEAVIVDTTNGTPSISVTINGNSRNATYQPPTDPTIPSTTLNFTYTAASNENDTNGIDISNTLSLNSGVIQDRANNVLGPSSRSFTKPTNLTSVLIDATTPTITEARVESGYYSGHVDIKLMSNKDIVSSVVSGTPYISLTVGNSTKRAEFHSSSSGSTLIFRYTIGANDNSDDGILMANSITLNGGTLQDSNGTNLLTSFASVIPNNLGSVIVDTTAPGIQSVTIANGSYSVLPIVVTMNEAVTVNTDNGVPSISVTINGVSRNATYQPPTNPTIPSTTLNFAYTAAANESDTNGIDDISNTLSLNNGVIQDRANNVLGPSSLSFTKPTNLTSVLIDRRAPTITAVRVESGYYSDHVDIELTSNKDIVSSVVSGTPYIFLTVGNSMKRAELHSSSSGSTLIFRYTIGTNDNSDDGILMADSIALNGGTLQDSNGTNLLTSFASVIPDNLDSVIVDTTAPGIQSVTIANGSYTTLPIVVAMNEVVTVNTDNGMPSISVTINGISRNAIYQPPADPTIPSTTLNFIYTAALNENDTNGIDDISNTLSLNSGVIQDRADNVLGPSSLSFTKPTNLTSVLIDATTPTITAARVESGYYSDHVDIKLTSSEDIISEGIPYIPLTINGALKRATLHSSSSGSNLVFRYNIQSGDNDNNGIEMTYSINSNGGTLKDSAGNVLVASFANVAPSNLDSVFVDTTAPQIQRVTIANGSYAILPIVVTMNEAVTVDTDNGTPSISVTINGVSRHATYQPPTDPTTPSTTLNFTYTAASNENDTNGIDDISNTLSLNSGVIQDRANNALGSSSLSFTKPTNLTSVLIDTTIPTITAARVEPGYYSNHVDIELTSNKNIESSVVNGTPYIFLTVGNSMKRAELHSSSSGSTLIFRYTIGTNDNSNGGILMADSITLNGGTLQDSNGNNLLTSFVSVIPDNLDSVIVDTTAPGIQSVTIANGSYAILPIVVTMNEAVIVDTTNGTPSISVTINGNTRNATYQPPTDPTIPSTTLNFTYTAALNENDTNGIDDISNTLSLNSGVIQDRANNILGPSSLSFTKPTNLTSVLIDATIPTITAARVESGYYSNHVDIKLTSSKDIVSNVVSGTPYVSLTVGSSTKRAELHSSSSGSNLVFRYTIGANDNSDNGILMADSITLNGGTLQDSNGNNLLTSFASVIPNNLGSVIVDTTAPGIQSVTIANGRYTVLPIVVTMNEAVIVDTTNGTPRISVTINGNSRHATYQPPTDPTIPSTILNFTYTAALNENDTNGIDDISNTLSLNGGVIQDRANNVLGPSSLSFTKPTNLTSVLIDTTAPTITAARVESGYYSDHVDIQLTSSKDIVSNVVSGTPYISLTVGSSTKRAELHSSSSGSNLVFRYDIQSGDNDENGIQMTYSINSNGGTLKDAAGNILVASFANVAPSNLGSVIVDTKVPLAKEVTMKNGTYAALSISVPMNEIVFVNTQKGFPTIGLDIDGTARQAVYQSGTGTGVLTFIYYAALNEIDSNGIGMTSSISFSDGVIKDRAGNNALSPLSFTAPNNLQTIYIDGAPPAIDSISGTSGRYTSAENLEVILSFGENVEMDTDEGNPYVVLDIGGEERHAVFNRFQNNSRNDLVFRYTVQAGDNDTDGIEIKSPLFPNGGKIQDLSGNIFKSSFSNTTLSAVIVDTKAPNVNTVTIASGTYSSLSISVLMSEDVTVNTDNGTPSIALNVGGTSRQATFQALRENRTLIFSYTAAEGERDTDGIGMASSLSLNGAVIKDKVKMALTDLSFTLPDNLKNVYIDTPLIVTSAKVAPGRYKKRDNIDITFTFSKDVTVDTKNGTKIPYLFFQEGSVLRWASYRSSPTSNSIVFRHQIKFGTVLHEKLGDSFEFFLNGGSIVDELGDAVPSSLFNTSTISFTNVQIDGQNPTISSIDISSGHYAASNQLDITIDTSENVVVTGTPLIALDIGGVNRNAMYNPGLSSDNKLVFRFTILLGDNAPNGISFSENPISLNGGSIKDTFGNILYDSVTLPSNLAHVIVDTTAPEIQEVRIDDGTYVDLSISVVLSEKVYIDTRAGIPSIPLLIDRHTRQAVYQSGTGSNKLIFSYTADTGETDTNGIDMTSSISLNGGSIKDRANNSLGRLSFTSPGNLDKVNVNGSLLIPRWARVYNKNYRTGENLDISIMYDENITVTGTPRIALDIGGTEKFATYVSSSSPSKLLTFRYTVVSTDKDSDGIGMTGSIDLNSGSLSPSSSGVTLVRDFQVPNNLPFVKVMTRFPFVFRWRTTKTHEDMVLPLDPDVSLNYSFIVDWGDNTEQERVTSLNDPDRSHSYARPDVYTVKIWGLLQGWNYSLFPDEASKLIEVVDLGDTSWKKLEGAFKGCDNLTSVSGGVLTGVTNMREMFSGQVGGQLTTVNSQGWNVGSVVDMSYLFSSQSNLVNLDVSTWDVSSVMNMSGLFYNLPSINLDVKDWDVSKVTNMSAMFKGATSANPDMGLWNVSSVTDMNEIFDGATLADPDVSNWNVSSVINMKRMFRDAIFANPDVSNWDISKVISMSSMFEGASSANPNFSGRNFQNIRPGSLNSDSHNGMDGMFLGASSFSHAHYSNLLMALESTNAHDNVSLDTESGLNRLITSEAAAARARLITDHNWTISD